MAGNARTGSVRTSVAAATAAVLLTPLLAGCLSDAESAGGSRSDATDLRLANAALRSPATCDELLDWYVRHGVKQVTAWGWNGVWPTELTYRDQFAPLPTQAAPATNRAQASETGTNVQEAGVDEPDIVKTDGHILVRVDGRALTTYDVTGDRPVLLDRIRLSRIDNAELLLSGDRVLVIGSAAAHTAAKPQPMRLIPTVDTAALIVLDIADPASIKITDSFTVDASLVTARQTDDVVRLVLSAQLPDLDFVSPGKGHGARWALRHNRQVVRNSSIADWLPTLTSSSGDSADKRPLLDCSQIAIPKVEAGLGTMVISGFDLDEPSTWTSTGVTTSSQTTYMSTDRLYLATDGWESFGPGPCCGLTDVRIAPRPQRTRLYAFALNGADATYVASGMVTGTVTDRWAMDEADGVLRLAVGPSAGMGNANAVVTLAERGSRLVEIGRLDGLGRGEQIQSVRWFDDLAIVVTFRQVDPLFAIDLSDPADPALLSALKIPGFSDYLHPLGQHRLLGIGMAADRRGATHGAQAALFDVDDLTDVRQLDATSFGGRTEAQAGNDPRQFTWLPDQRTALTVLSHNWGRRAAVAVIHVEDGQLQTWTRDISARWRVDQVRLVPLPGGRVILSDSDGVTFFDLAPGEG
ncbi:MAG: beta-propeller domain-containing protein [Nocardioides sp.]|uniref:beta-propeller domain-containing protein n=1 Tax=Nocardioides sp. TaxID=35761 RepID=UPI0039E6C93C